jgi:phosphatidylcholine synthase
MSAIWPAALVHLFTASGAVCGLFAMHAVGSSAWEAVFAWLGAALLIDGLDGTLARRVDAAGRLPRFSGERLDLVVDYLTYVFVPAAALWRFLGGAPGAILAALILLSSLYHFADTRSKDHDHCFVGFPAIWNIVAFYIFALGLPRPVATLIALTGVGLTFVPLRWAHPLRTARLLPLTILIVLIWAVAAVATVLRGFPASPSLAAVLLLAAVYALGLALLHSTVRPPARRLSFARRRNEASPSLTGALPVPPQASEPPRRSRR